MQGEEFRRVMGNPEALSAMMQIQQGMMRLQATSPGTAKCVLSLPSLSLSSPPPPLSVFSNLLSPQFRGVWHLSTSALWPGRHQPGYAPADPIPNSAHLTGWVDSAVSACSAPQGPPSGPSGGPHPTAAGWRCCIALSWSSWPTWAFPTARGTSEVQ